MSASAPPSVPMPTLMKASEYWTPAQQKSFLAIADAVIPELDGIEAADVLSHLPAEVSDRQRELAPRFAKEGFCSDPRLLDCAATQVKSSLSTKVAGDINLFLSLLSTRPGTLALTGHVGPFPDLDRATREKILFGWFTSRITLFRKASAGLKGIIMLVYYRNHQPAWEAIGYPDGRADDWSRSFEDRPSEDAKPLYDYKFENDKIAGQPSNTEIIVDTEVLVIGSGSGGGVAGSYLAQRGVRTLIVDKGIYLRPEQVVGREDQGYGLLYESRGIMPSEDGSINVLAGSGFGGGSTINWSASLKPRHFARRAWAEKYGVPYYNSPFFTSDLNAVCTRMGVAVAPIRHNISNSLLALGSQRAGHPVEPVPQNSGGHTHYCGKCQLGCISGHKQGGVVTWLKDAAEAGAAFMTNCYIDRIIFDKNKRAVGAHAVVDGRKVKILASKGVVVSSGSIQTPALLLRCPELKSNKMIGQTLRLHPATIITGYYNFPIKPWEGGLLTMVSNAAELVDKDGWGCKIEVVASSPSTHAALANFSSAKEHKARMLRYSYSYSMVIICRDRDDGKVVLDDKGQARMEYTISSFDQKSLVQGMLRGCDAHLMAGAEEIATAQATVPVFSATSLSTTSSPPGGATTTPVAPTDSVYTETTQIPATWTPVETTPRDLNDPAYQAWLKKVATVGAQPYLCSIASAHQMSSCRMGATPKMSTCDPEGRVWGAKNLWIADASIMPESSGVNPMITTMAGARGVARNVAREIGAVEPAHLRSSITGQEPRAAHL
ncbi:long-chain fatty alcohol dehydrogenase [Testicularia cyperi]|uniref:Long-chain-alcohol oxidase n=1 Tax=Testicularia cyperi TaxID=1882483 RepID=A0A317XK11_9BASI|nr:long-chain fatty alcohol dehydrogenase [Testicularia cyperi]